MSPEEKRQLQQRAVRAWNNSREATKLGLHDHAQRHWEECVRCCIEEKGVGSPGTELEFAL